MILTVCYIFIIKACEINIIPSLFVWITELMKILFTKQLQFSILPVTSEIIPTPGNSTTMKSPHIKLPNFVYVLAANSPRSRPRSNSVLFPLTDRPCLRVRYLAEETFRWLQTAIKRRRHIPATMAARTLKRKQPGIVFVHIPWRISSTSVGYVPVRSCSPITM